MVAAQQHRRHLALALDSWDVCSRRQLSARAGIEQAGAGPWRTWLEQTGERAIASTLASSVEQVPGALSATALLAELYRNE